MNSKILENIMFDNKYRGFVPSFIPPYLAKALIILGKLEQFSPGLEPPKYVMDTF